ncbi:MAG: hydrogen gas-evolving membrane-bound hydrogenase subunit E [Solirubrobacteraceae bacterium]
MSRRARTILFAAAAATIAAGLVWAVTGLPASGDYHGVYGLTLQHVALAQRHATNLVSAVTFDYRGFDTLGEEFILFVSATVDATGTVDAVTARAQDALRRNT